MVETRETKQKSIIEHEISCINTFFTAEQLHEKIKKKDAKMGIATVYRFLKELKKNREIHSYACNRKSLYSTKKLSHCHFTCENCAKMEHINVQRLDFLKNFNVGNICHFQIEVSGICPDCKNKR